MTTHCAGLLFKLGQSSLEYKPVRRNYLTPPLPLNRKTSLRIGMLTVSGTLRSLCSVYFLNVVFTCLPDAACVIVESANQMIETCIQFSSFVDEHEIVCNSSVPHLSAIACNNHR